MKKVNLIISLLVMLFISIGNVWADDPVYTLTFSKLVSCTAGNCSGDQVQDASSYTAPHDYTYNGYSWTMYGNQTLDGNIMRVGGKNTTNTDRTLTGTSAISSAISKVVVNSTGTFVGKDVTLTINSLKLEVGNADFSVISDTKIINNPDFPASSTSATAQNRSFEFTPTSDSWSAGSYYRITLNYCITGSNNSGVILSSIQFYEATGSGSTYSLVIADSL